MKRSILVVLVLAGCGSTGDDPDSGPAPIIQMSQPAGWVLAGTPVSFRVVGVEDPAAAAWDLGNGLSAVGEWAVTSYALPGAYAVTVTYLGRNSSRHIEVVADAPPVSVITPISSLSGSTPFHLVLDGSLSSDDDGIERMIWEVRKDSETTWVAERHTGETLDTFINNPGTYHVSLTVVDTAWEEAKSSEIEVVVTGPSLGLPRTPAISPADGLSAHDVVADLGAGFGTVAWDFGDGGTGSGYTTAYEYLLPGVYLPGVTETRSAGAVQTYLVDPVTVRETDATGPSRPATGPGSDDYPFPDTPQETKVLNSASGKMVYVFEPSVGGASAAGPFPVIFFCHGFGAVDVEPYRDFVEHLVRRGAIVIFPIWANASIPMGPSAYDALFQGFLDGLGYLETFPETSAADLERVGFLGHSAGGGAVTEMAGRGCAAGWGKKSVAVLSMAPYYTVVQGAEKDIHPWARVQIQVYAADRTNSDRLAVQQFHRLRHIPSDRKRYIVFQSDAHGGPALVADHALPTASVASISALQIGVWRQADALLDRAWTGGSLDLADGPEGLDLGTWSDDVPVAPLVELAYPFPQGPSLVRFD